MNSTRQDNWIKIEWKLILVNKTISHFYNFSNVRDNVYWIAKHRMPLLNFNTGLRILIFKENKCIQYTNKCCDVLRNLGLNFWWLISQFCEVLKILSQWPVSLTIFAVDTLGIIFQFVCLSIKDNTPKVIRHNIVIFRFRDIFIDTTTKTIAMETNNKAKNIKSLFCSVETGRCNNTERHERKCTLYNENELGDE